MNFDVTYIIQYDQILFSLFDTVLINASMFMKWFPRLKLIQTNASTHGCIIICHIFRPTQGALFFNSVTILEFLSLNRAPISTNKQIFGGSRKILMYELCMNDGSLVFFVNLRNFLC